MEQACQAIGAPRDRVVRALDYLAEQGHIELQVAGLRHRFKLLQRPGDAAALAKSLYEWALQRETAGNRSTRPGCRAGGARRLPGFVAWRSFRRSAARAVRPLLLVLAGRQAQPLAAAAAVANRSRPMVTGRCAAKAARRPAAKPSLVGSLPLRRHLAPYGPRQTAKRASVRLAQPCPVSRGADTSRTGIRTRDGWRRCGNREHNTAALACRPRVSPLLCSVNPTAPSGLETAEGRSSKAVTCMSGTRVFAPRPGRPQSTKKAPEVRLNLGGFC